MALISATRFQKKEKIKAEISSVTNKKIHDYCKWAGIENIGYFLEEAAEIVFRKDPEWKKHIKKSAKKRSESVETA